MIASMRGLPLPAHRCHSPARVSRQGFSLVEVTIALALATFAVVSVLGLLPTGLHTMRDAMSQSTVTQITREISTELLLTPFQQLTNYASSPLYFDAQGQRTTDPKAYYRVDLALADPEFPGSSLSATISAKVRCVRLQIVSRAYQEGAGATNHQVLHVAGSGF